jgi:hypothetical protein
MEIKVLDSIEYIGRDLFVLEVNGKYLNVYRSSGLSGTGHGGEILPFSRLKETESMSFRDNVPGYIYKEMFFGGYWTNHYKDVWMFPRVGEFMEILKSFLKEIKPTKEVSIEILKKKVNSIFLRS